ncbi:MULTISPECIES: cyclic nucleotide-binding/CBS domain-containing protein [unclassified Blastococcus]|uniref:CBS domain-containing protein n=1 Tax=unclassified Blastococcus TaxID=2619396 RepID=UPI001EF11858|nr:MULTISPECIES: CBS domain-containing protein [unclassified Blastococcus]
MPTSTSSPRATTPGTPGRPTVGRLVRSVPGTVEPGAVLTAAASRMARAGAGALVVDDGAAGRGPVAVVTDADVTRAVADGLDPAGTRIDQLGLARVEPLTAGTPVEEAARRMVAEQRQELPVRDGEQVVGVVELLAVCDALLGAGPAADEPDPGQGIRNMGG